jgi:hypothetical protein
VCRMDLIGMEDEDLLSRVLAQAATDAAVAPKPQARPAAAAGPDWDVPGILGTTRVTTSFGHVPAHLVRVGDTLKARDGSFVRVQRITDIRIDEDFLARHPQAAPVIVRKNGHGSGVPHQDVGLSPAQLVSVGPNRFEDRLVASAGLSRERGGIDKSLGILVYFRFHLGRAAQINCDGLWVAIAD